MKEASIAMQYIFYLIYKDEASFTL